MHLRGCWITHNDSGDGPVLYCSRNLSFHEAQACVVEGARAIDWEDVTVLDGDVIVADTGNNMLTRRVVTLYRVRFEGEPCGTDSSGPGGLQLVGAYHLKFPDGPHDVEALTAWAGRLLLVTKARREPETLLFEIDDLPPVALGVKKPLEPRLVGKVPLPEGWQVTAADSDSSGRIFLLTYRGIAEIEVTSSGVQCEIVRGFSAGQCEALCVTQASFVITNEERDVFVLPRR